MSIIYLDVIYLAEQAELAEFVKYVRKKGRFKDLLIHHAHTST